MLDEYSLTHVAHGVVEATLVSLICIFVAKHNWRRPVPDYHVNIFVVGFFISLGLEVAWEILENQKQRLKYYDFKGMAYAGDSIVNSGMDVVSMSTGYWAIFAIWKIVTFVYYRTFRPQLKLHNHTRPWAIIVAACFAYILLSELFLFWRIRDGFFLSVVQFSWTLSTKSPPPAFFKWVEEQRSLLVVKPIPKFSFDPNTGQQVFL
jgi:hypothetical protein